MKILLLIVSLGLFISCSDPSENPEPNFENYSSLIIGDWEYHTQEYSDRGDLPYLITGCASDRYYRFNSDGTQDRYDYESISSNQSENYEENGYIIRKNTCSGDFGLKGNRKYEIIDNRIYYTNSDRTESVARIEKLEENTLIIQWNTDAEYFSKWKYRVVYKRK